MEGTQEHPVLSFGAPIDREVGDMVPKEPLDVDLGRRFLYVRYDADLSAEGLERRALGRLDPRRVAKLDSIRAIPDLIEIGKAVAGDVRPEHFGAFLSAARAPRP